MLYYQKSNPPYRRVAQIYPLPTLIGKVMIVIHKKQKQMLET